MDDAGEAVSPKDQFLDSLNRCSENEDFMSDFYARFMESSDEVRHKFRFTKFDKQKKMLLQSLQLSAAACEGEPEALREIVERARTHSRHHLDVRPVLYDLWLDSLIITAREYDCKWDDSTENAWRTVLGFVIKRMIAKY